MTVTKETPKKGIKSPLRFILFYNKRIVRKWQMLITPRIMSTKAVDIPKQRVVDVDNYEDYVMLPVLAGPNGLEYTYTHCIFWGFCGYGGDKFRVIHKFSTFCG